MRFEEMTEKEKILSCRWPLFPLLPMKRGTNLATMELGLMLAGEWNIIYKGDLFFSTLKTVGDLKQLPCLIYDDLDALLAAGWLGD
jgi:hypothetical protein